MEWRKDRPVWRCHPYEVRQHHEGHYIVMYHYPGQAGVMCQIGGKFHWPDSAMEFATSHAEETTANITA